jgi:hypothetical protein
MIEKILTKFPEPFCADREVTACHDGTFKRLGRMILILRG